ncbi:hypothetical protein HJC23_003660 [Cyclotella cryptica]|uniref:Glutamine amidotransferase domain-containing protein n=1 Tax=Cyclotella cryptica TaxID=29204 RepID=A0ABD3QIV9_9STRA|eukprot:CCRYP_004967-RA/>CCRYP_004967-RA protein AED:0.23 eAED:0.23 QI:0/-1/0/1/-1/1/1/0/358
MSKARTIVSKDLLSPESIESTTNRELKLMMICCEENAPYGPASDTARMFLQLLGMAYERFCSLTNGRDSKQTKLSSVTIAIYHAQDEDYPSSEHEWNSYDGVIIPGSLSCAYDTHTPWIRRLHTVIREEIHENRRKTLAVCFGHQSFAHAFGEGSNEIGRRNGEAIKCPTGKKAGRKPFNFTSVGECLLAYPLTTGVDTNSKAARTSLEMLYTHGDMVGTLPTVGLSLGGNGEVPIQSAAYFASQDCALKFNQYADSLQHGSSSTSTSHLPLTGFLNRDDQESLPYAMTFQAHPEYVSVDGFKVHFLNVLKTMEKLHHIDSATSKQASEDATRNFDRVLTDSLDVMVSVGVILGWFQD